MQTLFDLSAYSVTTEDFTSDDYETPPEIAAKMARLIRSSELSVLEPCAGRGAIVRELCKLPQKKIRAIELKPNRVEDGKILAPAVEWLCADFVFGGQIDQRLFDVVITNPPFSVGLEFIERSLDLLNWKNPNARLLFLLPGDYFASQERCDRFEALDCHISHRWRIRGRVAYFKEGVQQIGRQISDCVYEIKPGKVGATETVL